MKIKDFVILWFGTLGFWFSVASLATLFPLFMDRAGYEAGWIGFVTGSAALGGLIVRPVVGWAIDRWGTRGFLLAGGGIWLFTSPLVPLLNTPELLLGMRLIQGVGGAMFTAAALGYVGFVTPFEVRGRIISLWDTSGSAANLVAPVLVAGIVMLNGFQLAFWVSGLAGLFAMLFALFLPHVVPGKKAEGAIVPFRFIALSAVKPGLFAIFAGLGTAGFIVLGPLVADILGLPNAGIFVMLFSIGSLAVRPLSAPLSDRLGRNRVILPGLFLLAIALGLIGLIQETWVGYVAPFLFGFGLGSVVPGLMALCVDGSKIEERGSAGNTFYAFWEIGIFLGAYLQGLLLERFGLESYLLTAGITLLTAVIFWLYARQGQIARAPLVEALPLETPDRARW
jgi:MFS family permease